MVPFDRPYMTFYSSAIVSIGTVFELFVVYERSREMWIGPIQY